MDMAATTHFMHGIDGDAREYRGAVSRRRAGL
jgi:hypothetical protein